MSKLRKSECRGETCTATIFWAIRGKGEFVPLDFEPHLKPPGGKLAGLWVLPRTNSLEARPAVDGDPPPFYMNHFATCVDRKDFG